MVVLWDRASGKMIREISLSGKWPATHLRFSADDRRLYGSAAYGRDMKLYAWDVATGEIAKDIPALPENARTLGYSPDGRELLLIENDTQILQWVIATGKERGRHVQPAPHTRFAALLGERLLAAYFDGKQIMMWDVAKKKQLWSVANEHTRSTSFPMAFSPDARLIAVEMPPKAITVFDAVTGNALRRFGVMDKTYWSFAFSPDGKTLAASNWDGTVRLFDLQSGKERAKSPVEGWETNVFFSPDSQIFATGDGNNAHAVRLWDAATGKSLNLPGHASPISCVAFAPNGQLAATSSWLRGDPQIHLWEVRTGRFVRTLETSNRGGVQSVTFSPDGKWLAACGWDENPRVQVWDAHTGELKHSFAGHEAGCNSVAFSPDGKRLVSADAYYDRTGNGTGRICIWDVLAGKRLREIRGTPGAVQRVFFSHDGRHIIAGANGVHIYEANSGRRVIEPILPKSRIWSLALSGDGRLLAVDGKLWELATRREIEADFPKGARHGAALTVDGRTLVTRCDHDIVVFNWAAGRTLRRVETWGAFLSSNSRLLATLERCESSVLIWDLPDPKSIPILARAKPTDEEIRRWWGYLAGEDPGMAYWAIWKFTAVPTESLAFLNGALSPIPASDPGRVTRLLADLDSGQFSKRKQASDELARLGEAVLDRLRKERMKDASLEKQRRIDELIAQIDRAMPGPEQLRAVRAAALLEQIGGKQARDLLAKLAEGDPEARLTREAKSSLERFKQPDR